MDYKIYSMSLSQRGRAIQKAALEGKVEISFHASDRFNQRLKKEHFALSEDRVLESLAKEAYIVGTQKVIGVSGQQLIRYIVMTRVNERDVILVMSKHKEIYSVVTMYTDGTGLLFGGQFIDGLAKEIRKNRRREASERIRTYGKHHKRKSCKPRFDRYMDQLALIR